MEITIYVSFILLKICAICVLAFEGKDRPMTSVYRSRKTKSSSVILENISVRLSLTVLKIKTVDHLRNKFVVHATQNKVYIFEALREDVPFHLFLKLAFLFHLSGTNFFLQVFGIYFTTISNSMTNWYSDQKDNFRKKNGCSFVTLSTSFVILVLEL